MHCNACGEAISSGAFIDRPDGTRRARCHGCLAFLVIAEGETEPTATGGRLLPA